MLRSFFAREEGQGLFGREAGQGLVEYALILALVSIALIAILLLMSGALNTIFQKVTDTLNNASS